LAVRSSNDNNRVIGNLKPISYKQNITWGFSLPVWGDTESKWNAQGLIEEWRRFPAGGLRCQYKQIQFYNDTVEIISSDLLGSVTVDATAKTITLNGTTVFPSRMENYVAQVSSDTFGNDYTILSQSSNTLVVSDPGNKLIDGTYDFKVVGIPKDEILELTGYIFNFAFLGRSHTPFTAGS
jgi:hypothetical protein